MRTKIVSIAVISLLCAMVLTGCRISINTDGKGKEPKVDVEIPGIDVKIGNTDKREECVVSGTSSETPVGNATIFAIENEMGDIKVTTTTENKITVNYTVKVTGDNDENCRKAADGLTIAPSTSGDKTLLKAKIDGEENVGNYVKDKYGNLMNVQVDLDVTIPAKYEELSVLEAMGDVSVTGFKGKLSLLDSMGNIKANDLTLTADSEIKNAMGDVAVSIREVAGSKVKFDMRSAMGRIDLDTNGLALTNKEVKDEGISGSFKVTVGGNLEVTAETEMGGVSVN